MGFHLYFAGSQNKEVMDYIIDNNCDKLFSYANEIKQIHRFMDDKKEGLLFVDSGAFSMARDRAYVDIDRYIQFINSFSDKIDVFAELDSIPYPVLNAITTKKSQQESYDNYKYILEQVDCPEKILYVYHFGEPKEKFLEVINTPINGFLPEYVGLGGRHGISTLEHDKYFEDMFNLIERSDNPNIKVHAFGMTVLWLLEKYPFYSADSTTWLILGANGNIMTRCYDLVSISNNSLSDVNSFRNLDKKHQTKVLEELEEYGYDLQELIDDYKQRLIWNVQYYKEWADNYQYKPAKIKRSKLF